MKSTYYLPIVLLLLTALPACQPKEKGVKAATEKEQTYTCPMHPQVVQHKPGTCPICGMDLVPFDKSNPEAFLTLSDNQIALANISTRAIGTGSFADLKRLNGRLATNPEKTVVISARVPGRVEALYVKETGVRVHKGQPLYKIYSEQLAALQQEYLLAAAQARQFPEDARFQQIAKTARQRLALYDQTDAQLNQLLQAGKTNPYVSYPATADGLVAELSITEGQYVAEGSAILRLESYNELWVEADLYPAEASLLRVGQTVQVLIAGWEQQPQTMQVRFIEPSLQAGSQLLQVRGNLANPQQQWQPGLQATLLAPVQTASQGLTLPVNAVIRGGNGTHVWVKTGAGKFEPRIVTTGQESAESVTINSGLGTGDTVVITGAYLLYSEYLLKKGADPIAHQH